MTRLVLNLFCACQLASCLWSALIAPVPWLAPFVWFGAFWLPGAALASLARGGDDAGNALRDNSAETLWMPLATGPVVFGLLLCVLRTFSVPLRVAALIPVLLGGVVFLWHVNRSGTLAASLPVPRVGLPLIAGAVVFLVGVIPILVFEPLRFRSDAHLHLPVIQSILSGFFPPDNPFLAGEKLAYFWFYHLILAGAGRLSGISTELLPPILNAQAMIILLLAMVRTSRILRLSTTAQAAAVALLAVGLSGFGWIRLVVTLVNIPETGFSDALSRGAVVIFPLLSPEDPRLAGLLTKFAVSNAFPMSLGLFCLAMAPAMDGRRATTITRSLLIAGTIFLHLLTGALLVAALLFRWCVTRLMRRRRDGGNRPLAASPLVPLVAAAIVTAPYVVDIVRARTGEGAAVPGFFIAGALVLLSSLVVPALLMLPVLSVWIRDSFRSAYLAGWLPILTFPFFVHLVGANEYKVVFLLLVLASPVAASGLERLARTSRPLVIVALLILLPGPLIAAAALAFEESGDSLSPGRRAGLSRAVAALPEDAIFVQENVGPIYSQLTVPLKRSFYLSDRSALWVIGQWDSPEAQHRRRVLASAKSGDLSELVDASRFGIEGRPLYFIQIAESGPPSPQLNAALSRAAVEVVYSDESTKIFRFLAP